MPLPIPDVSALDAAFGSIKHMPSRDQVPKEFRDWNNEWHGVFSAAFYRGGSLSSLGIKPKEGVDVSKALAAIRAVMASFEPKHEDKAAACAFMFSEWFEMAEVEAKP